MTRLHFRHLKSDIDAFTKSVGVKVVDKQALLAELTGKWSIKPSLAEKMADILMYVADKESVSSPSLDSSSSSVETGTAHTDVLTLTFRLGTMLFTYFKENTGDSDAPSLR